MKSNSISQSIQAFILATALLFSGLAAAEPSLQEINQTLKSGDIAKADRLMQEVIGAHPDSAKAHFKYAEILAAEGTLDKARAELSTAENLQPNLDFAKPTAVAALKHKIAGDGSYHTTNPLVVWAAVAFVVIFLFFIIRTLFRRPQVQPYYATNPQTPNAYGQQGPYPNNGYGPQGGLGSNIASGLATGAAVGAGIVAGEMLMHKILDDDQPSSHDSYARNQPAPSNYDDISGNDFVDNDNGSWDSGSSSDSDFSSGGDSGGDWS